MRRKTPQQKKALSYANDRRNDYGENDKGSRKSVRRHKRFPNRAYRRKLNQNLQKVAGEIDAEQVEEIEGKIKGLKRRIWKKCADITLEEFVKNQLWKRQNRVGGKLRRKLKLQAIIGVEK